MRYPKAYSESGRTQVISTFTEPTTVDQPFEAESNPDLVKKLDYEIFLPFAAKTYKISPRIEDYLIIPTIICPSDLPNRNGIAFPKAELVKYQPPPISRQVYKAWSGVPVHLEHDNEDPEKALGIVLDTAFTQIKDYGNGEFWKVMGLVGIDKKKAPEIAQRFINKTLSTFSMGCMADYFTCSICGQECEKDTWRNCSHIHSTGAVNWNPVRTPDGALRIAYLNAHGLSPIELSVVSTPAWVPALSDTILSDGMK